MASLKTKIIEELFRARWSARTRALREPLVTMAQVQEAIRRSRKRDPRFELSDKNPANFFKDLIRSSRRNNLFPKFVVRCGYTARQAVGEGGCFEFVRLPTGAKTAFREIAPSRALLARPHPIETISMPLASRRLGRSDESWLTQVVVRLNVLATHFAVRSERRARILQLDILQVGVKLGAAEIDALFLLTEQGQAGPREVLVSCEMKGRREEIEEEQISRGAEAVLGMPQVGQGACVPAAVKVVGKSLLYVVEFNEIQRKGAGRPPLGIASEGVYCLLPAVPGIE